MNIVKKIKTKAFWRWIENKGYNARFCKVLWKSKNVAWNWLAISWGIRRSDRFQVFPVWNMSNNSSRSLLFGFGFWYFEIQYHRKKSFNQRRKLPFKSRFRKFYQLFF